MPTQEEFDRAALKVICSYDTINYINIINQNVRKARTIGPNTSVEIRRNDVFIIDFISKYNEPDGEVIFSEKFRYEINNKLRTQLFNDDIQILLRNLVDNLFKLDGMAIL